MPTWRDSLGPYLFPPGSLRKNLLSAFYFRYAKLSRNLIAEFFGRFFGNGDGVFVKLKPNFPIPESVFKFRVICQFFREYCTPFKASILVVFNLHLFSKKRMLSFFLGFYISD